jgi:hypothetical protein
MAALLVSLALAPPMPPAVQPSGPVAYSGSGAWIDRYDFNVLPAPELVVSDMAAHGVKTVYVETGSWKVPRGVDVVAPRQTSALIAAAHAHGMKIVGWYLPGFRDLRTDWRRMRAALAFQTPDGQRFDSVALDIEATLLNPIARRNAALLELSRRLRDLAGADYPLGAIVPDERSATVAGGLWPHFPYAAVARYYDVFLPMAYSTMNRARGAAGVYAYTKANVRFLKRATERPVHLIAGLTGSMSADEQAAATVAARDAGAIGVSLYNYRFYNPGSWLALSAFDSVTP